jgi:hypothetical protein
VRGGSEGQQAQHWAVRVDLSDGQRTSSFTLDMSLTPLTHDQFLHLHEAWRLFDTDCDGLVTPKDLQTLLRSFGYEHSLVGPPCPFTCSCQLMAMADLGCLWLRAELFRPALQQ